MHRVHKYIHSVSMLKRNPASTKVWGSVSSNCLKLNFVHFQESKRGLSPYEWEIRKQTCYILAEHISWAGWIWTAISTAPFHFYLSVLQICPFGHLTDAKNPKGTFLFCFCFRNVGSTVSGSEKYSYVASPLIWAGFPKISLKVSYQTGTIWSLPAATYVIHMMTWNIYI